MNEFSYGIREVNLNILKLSIMGSWLGGPLEMVMGHPPYSSHTGLLHTIRHESYLTRWLNSLCAN